MNTRHQQRLTAAGLASLVLALFIAPTAPVAAVLRAQPSPVGARTEASGPYATLLFSRTEMTAADDCAADNLGIAQLRSVVAPYLGSLGMSATGTLVTDRTRWADRTCTHSDSSMTASWADATALVDDHGWTFTSHTATYPGDLAGLTPTQARAETCGSAQTLDDHGLPGAHGMISYPGAQPDPLGLQTTYSATCFAWGREYGSSGITASAAGQTLPYWQHTYAANGGPCNEPSAACYSIPATGSGRYRLPSTLISIVNGLSSGQWFTLQAYVLVRGQSPSYASSPISWDCTSPDPRLHWSNDNERYCYRDWQAVVQAIHAKPQIVVTDPLTVGIAFGRPATYP